MALCPMLAVAQEAGVISHPIKSEAHELKVPTSDLLAYKDKAPSRSPEETVHFFNDTTLKFNLRNYYLSKEDAADALDSGREDESWTQGGSLQYRSGRILNTFSIAAQVFTSQKLYGPEDKDGALLLEPGQDPFTVLGVLNPRFDFQGHALSLYRQRLELPYINGQDSRMAPNTFQSYSYAYLSEHEDAPFKIGLGYIDKIKKRNSDEFIYLSEAAGVDGHERGMPWFGLRYQANNGIKLSAVNYAGLDFLNIFYGELDYSKKLEGDWSLKTSVQFSEQRSIGDDLLTDENISVAMFGLQHALSYKKFMIRTAFTTDDKGMNFRSPFGAYPGYNSAIVEDFNRAGEITWKIGISYDFSGMGLGGVTAYADYISGNRAVDANKNPLNDRDEIDLNIDYKPQEGYFEGFWLRVRNGFVYEDSLGRTDDFRVILNYDLQVLGG